MAGLLCRLHDPALRLLRGALRILVSFLVPTRLEKGCILYDLHENPDDPDDLTFIEEWESETDLDSHGQAAHILEGRRKMPEVMEEQVINY